MEGTRQTRPKTPRQTRDNSPTELRKPSGKMRQSASASIRIGPSRADRRGWGCGSKARQWALQKEHQRQAAKTPPSDEKKQNHAPQCPPWPLAACPSPEASHNKADLNKVMSLPIRSESGARVRAVGLAVRQRGLGTQKERKNEPKKKTRDIYPAPWALPHTSPRSYPRPSFL